MGYFETLRDYLDANAPERLVLYKAAMRRVSVWIDVERGTPAPASSKEDRLGVTMKFLCAVEGGPLNEISTCLLCSPALKDMVDSPYRLDENLTRRLRGARLHAIQLAREHAMDELGH